MRRRQFLRQVTSGAGSIGASQFLPYFLRYGAPALSASTVAMAADKAEEADTPRFLIYWFMEGGWMGYDMFNPVDSSNNVAERLEKITDERYRVLKWGEEGYGISTHAGIRHGYLAEDGRELFPEMAALSSMSTGRFHSGERLKSHMGDYALTLQADRGDDERSVMQAFAEVQGQPYILPNLSWHWWLSDGELNEVQYTGRKGYYHALGPSHAHTIYARTPARMRSLLQNMHRRSTDAVNARIESFLGDMEDSLLDDDGAEVIKSYVSASSIYKNLANRGGSLDPNVLSRLFNDSRLKEQFKIEAADELITYRSINGNKARSKFTPASSVQAMMAFELMRAGYSCAFWIENRGIRKYDSHLSRQRLWENDGVTPRGMPDTKDKMRQDLWDPLKALVAQLKATQYKNTGKSLWDFTTIVLTSEFGRTMHGSVDRIKKMNIPEMEKREMIGNQDISSHWQVTSCAFLGAGVRGGRQYGGAGENTLMPIPILPDGSIDPAFDPITGEKRKGAEKSDKSFVPNHGNVYASALDLTGIDPTGRGRNTRPPLRFLKKA